MRRADRLLFAAGAFLIAAYFLILTRFSFRAYFTPDDMLNLYRAWKFPASLLVKGNLLFFRVYPFYRPLGSAWYRVLFHFAGFRPLPFHIVYAAIFLLNLYLTYAIASRLSGSRETGAVTTLLSAYHNRLNWLYLDTSFSYDALCFTFYFAALLLYIRARQQKRLPGAGELMACAALFICALNSKEMGVTLPLFLLLYELLYHSPARWRAGDLARWTFREGRGTWVVGVISVVFVIGMMTDPNSLSSNPFYRPTFTTAQFMKTSTHFLGDVFSENHDWAGVAVLALWGGMLAIAGILRSRVLFFAWLFLMLTPLPIAFIYPRGPAQYYIPWFGWSLYAGALLMKLIGRIPANARIRGCVTVGTLAVLLFLFFENQGWGNATDVTVEAPRIRNLAEEVHGQYPRLRPGSRLYFLNDPFDADRYDLAFTLRLRYGDDTLTVLNGKREGRAATEAELATYDHVFDYQAGQFYELTRPWRRSSVPIFALGPDGPEVYHENFEPLTKSPAAPGELVITKAINLGATEPPVPDGQPFAKDPLLPVAQRIEVRVNGRMADVVTKIGWPDLVNTYRVDFRVPPETRRGKARVEMSAAGVKGQAIEIPVR